VRLHYVYPYPHVRELVPLMAEGLILPYLDIPFQHAHPDTLRRMARPAAAARTLDEIAAWRAVCPEITLRSTFIVGYPGETEAEFATLLDWLDEAQLDRVGLLPLRERGRRAVERPARPCARGGQGGALPPLHGARAGDFRGEAAAKVGREIPVIVDEVDEEAATCRSMADAPEIDGNVFLDEGFEGLAPGDIVTARIEEAGEYDLWGRPLTASRGA
jgi:ribosomal protein S12 methylthiotransferase